MSCISWASLSDEPVANETEVAELRYVTADQISTSELESEHRKSFTPWLRMEWQRLNDDYASVARAIPVYCLKYGTARLAGIRASLRICSTRSQYPGTGARRCARPCR